MAGNFESDWTTAEPLSDINIVPLVDVLLVLLVIFMITAPIISPTLDVQLPRTSLSTTSRTTETLIVTIDREGRLAVNDTVIGLVRSKLTSDRFEREIQRWKLRYPGTPVFLRADRRIRYGTVIQVMAQLRRMGVVDVGLMIEREAS